MSQVQQSCGARVGSSHRERPEHESQHDCEATRKTVALPTSSFELGTGGGKVRILDARGRVVAEVGKRVAMGGGEIGKQALRENGVLDERTWRELFERCPPGYSYWLVGEGVHIPQRG